MKKFILINTLLYIGATFLSIVQAQDTAQFIGIPVNVTVKLKVPEANFMDYDTLFKAKRIFTDVSQVSNSTVEELVSSVYSADNQKWVNFNYYQPEQAPKFNKKEYKERASKNIDTSFYQLIHRLSFLHDGIPTAIVKYRYIKEGVPQNFGSLIAQNINNRWYVVNIPELEEQRKLIQAIKTEMFIALSTGRARRDDILKQLIDQTRGVFFALDITALSEFYSQWVKENNMEMLKHFCDGY
ncbi:MAG TPA: hypothetical protein VIK89_00560 [Cytophagaceae bacterium]